MVAKTTRPGKTYRAKKSSFEIGSPKKAKPDQPVLVSRKIARLIMRRLCEQYPDAQCELSFATPFQLLIATILSAQTTDVSVNKVTTALFKRYPDPNSLAKANLDELKQLIKPTGYYNTKANNIKACAQMLVSKFQGIVPYEQEELVSLPGVGRKTANVVLGVAFGVPGWTVDTHVQRLAKRLGYTEEADPYKIELALQRLFPKADWSLYSITLIWHGRRLCFARKPNCLDCPVKLYCPSAEI